MMWYVWVAWPSMKKWLIKIKICKLLVRLSNVSASKTSNFQKQLFESYYLLWPPLPTSKTKWKRSQLSFSLFLLSRTSFGEQGHKLCWGSLLHIFWRIIQLLVLMKKGLFSHPPFMTSFQWNACWHMFTYTDWSNELYNDRNPLGCFQLIKAMVRGCSVCP